MTTVCVDLRARRDALAVAAAGGEDAARIPLGCVLEQLHEHALAVAALEPALARETNRRLEVEGRIALAVAKHRLGHPDAELALRAAADRAVALVGPRDPLTAQAYWELGSTTRDEQLLEHAAQIWNAYAQPAWAMRARAFIALIRNDSAGAAVAYASAIAALDHAIGDSVALIDVLLEAALVNDRPAASRLRERALRLAQTLTGPGSQRTANVWLEHTLAEDDLALLDRAIASVGTDAAAAGRLALMKAVVLDKQGDASGALRAREQYLAFREQEIGADSQDLVPLIVEIRSGWEARGRADEAEAFLYRCRERTRPEGVAFRNLTFSIARLLAARGRHAELAPLWRSFVAAREAACPANSPAVIEARDIAKAQLAAAAADSVGLSSITTAPFGRPGRPPTTAPSGPHGAIDGAAESSSRALLDDRIRRDVESIEPYLLLAEELTATGDPRGELIVVQHCLRTTPDDPKLTARERQLLADHREALFGTTPSDAVRWHLGFFERLSLDLRGDPRCERLIAALAHPSAIYLRDIALTVAYCEGDYPRQATNVAAALAAITAAVRPTVRSLTVLARLVDDDRDLAWSDGCPHQLVNLAAALPALERLELGGVDVVHGVTHPNVASLVLHDRPICPLARWDLPAASRVEWVVDGSTIGRATDCELAMMDPVWDQQLPALRELVIRGSFTDCEESIARPLIANRLRALHRLTIDASALGDDPLDTLRTHADLVRHLRLRVLGADDNDPRLERLQRELPKLKVGDSARLSTSS